MIKPLVYLLIADDSDPDIELFRIALKKSNIKAILLVVKDGEDLLKFLKKESPFEKVLEPDMVLLDIAMPNMNGIEALKQIKSNPKLNHIPIVMLTNSDRDQDIKLSYENYANSYIVKPFRENDYSKVINAINEYWFSISQLPDKQKENL